MTPVRPLFALLLLPVAMSAQKPIVEGKADSPVRVIIYEDLQCSDCAVFRRMLDERLLPAYAARVAFEHRDFPLAKHAWARQAAIVARYIQSVDPARCLEFRRQTLDAQRSIKADAFPAWVKSFCAKNGLDAAAALAALGNADLQALVQHDFAEGTARGIAHTPTVLVDGEPFIESFTFEQVVRAIEASLKEYKDQ